MVLDPLRHSEERELYFQSYIWTLTKIYFLYEVIIRKNMEKVEHWSNKKRGISSLRSVDQSALPG